MGQLNLPAGKRVAVNLGVDFDAQSLWLGGFNQPTPATMARGEFGAMVGAPRLLDLFAKYEVRSTWFTPGHTVDTFSDICRRIVAGGHEVGYHGYYHENPRELEPEMEERLMQLALDTFTTQLGVRPRGYRYWDYAERTPDLIERFGFDYDSSLMGRDIVPYRSRRWQVRWEKGCVRGRANRFLEIPVSWYLDDFPPMAYVQGVQTGMYDSETVLRHWQSIFDYAYAQDQATCYIMAVHPQVIGQAHNIQVFERLVEYIAGKDGTWFATCAEICDAWEDDDEDRAAMDMGDELAGPAVSVTAAMK